MNKKLILIVDDIELNRKILCKTLSEEYDILEASNGIEALSVIGKNPNLSLVILDIMMPELNGIEVLKIMKSKAETIDIPIILITAADSNEEYALELGAVDFIAKPFNVNVVRRRVRTHIELRDLKNGSAYAENDSVYKEISELVLSCVILGNRKSFPNIVSKNRHAVAEYIKRLKKANLFEINKITEHDIINSICLRDIGKLFISDEILLKGSNLTDEEFVNIKKHTTLSNIILKKVPKNLSAPVLSLITDICYYHHENFDGTGYPIGLKGKSIPFSARVASLFDCYEAMITDKPYRAAHTHNYAINFISENKGKKFDPELAYVFVNMSTELERIYFLL